MDRNLPTEANLTSLIGNLGPDKIAAPPDKIPLDKNHLLDSQLSAVYRVVKQLSSS